MASRDAGRTVYPIPFSAGRPTVRSELLDDALNRLDGGDTWATALSPSDSREAVWWNNAMFGKGPAWAEALMNVRNFVVRLFRLKVVESDSDAVGFDPNAEFVGFPELASNPPGELLTGVDGPGLNVRCLVVVTETEASLTTLVQVNTLMGRLYWGVVRPFHSRIARAAVAKIPPA